MPLSGCHGGAQCGAVPRNAQHAHARPRHRADCVWIALLGSSQPHASMGLLATRGAVVVCYSRQSE
eukprot:1850805-Lingulodinium_polyedra.AAC.1